jgi:Glycosyl hydrolase family 76
VKAVAQTIATELVSLYPLSPSYANPYPTAIIGLFGDPYYWWEAGAAWGALIDYWFYTGDSQFNDLVTTALLSQVGPDNDYMPPNQTKSEVSCRIIACITATNRSRETMIKYSGPWLQCQPLNLNSPILQQKNRNG